MHATCAHTSPLRAWTERRDCGGREGGRRKGCTSVHMPALWPQLYTTATAAYQQRVTAQPVNTHPLHVIYCVCVVWCCCPLLPPKPSQAKSFQQEIHKQMQQRSAQAALRKQRAQASRYRKDDDEHDDGSGAGAGADNDDEDAGRGRDRSARGHHQPGEQKQHGSRKATRGSSDGGSSSEEEEEVRRSKMMKRKKPRAFM